MQYFLPQSSGVHSYAIGFLFCLVKTKLICVNVERIMQNRRPAAVYSRYDDRMVNTCVSGGFFLPHLKRSISVNVNTFLSILKRPFLKKNAYFYKIFLGIFVRKNLCVYRSNSVLYF